MRRQWLAVGLAVGMLAGCVTEGGVAPTKSSPVDAAAYNLQLGAEYLRAGKLSLARERLESSVKQNPKVARAHFTLAILYQTINEPELADRSFRNAIRTDPDDAAVQNTYAVHLCGKKRYDQAEKYFTRAATNPLYQTPEAAWTNAGVCMRDKGDLAAAERYFREALKVERSFPDALLELATLKLETGNPLSARAFLERLMAVREATPQLLLLAWEVERTLGDTAAASRFSERLLQDFPDSVEAERVGRGG
ncbi:MAG: type IV pilus biogenesis/stability protein PilW [Pseudomonadota bacterium]